MRGLKQKIHAVSLLSYIEDTCGYGFCCRMLKY